MALGRGLQRSTWGTAILMGTAPPRHHAQENFIFLVKKQAGGQELYQSLTTSLLNKCSKQPVAKRFSSHYFVGKKEKRFFHS